MYVLLLERLERQVLVEQHITAVLAAAGAKGVEMPVFAERQAELDAWLLSEDRKAHVDPETAELMSVLGVS